MHVAIGTGSEAIGHLCVSCTVVQYYLSTGNVPCHCRNSQLQVNVLHWKHFLMKSAKVLLVQNIVPKIKQHIWRKVSNM